MRKVMLFPVLAAALLLLAAQALGAPVELVGKKDAPEPRISGARVLEYGLFSSTAVDREKAATVADGIRDEARDFTLLKKNAKVAAAQGQGVGLRYEILGEPQGAGVQVEIVVRHPEMRQPETGKAMRESRVTAERAVGQPAYALWSFDTQAGLLPGEYVVEVLYRGRSLARQVFQVSFGAQGKKAKAGKP